MPVPCTLAPLHVTATRDPAPLCMLTLYTGASPVVFTIMKFRKQNLEKEDWAWFG